MQPSTGLYETFFKTATDAMFVFERATKTLINANTQALKDTGYRFEELNGFFIDRPFRSGGCYECTGLSAGEWGREGMCRWPAPDQQKRRDDRRECEPHSPGMGRGNLCLHRCSQVECRLRCPDLRRKAALHGPSARIFPASLAAARRFMTFAASSVPWRRAKPPF